MTARMPILVAAALAALVMVQPVRAGGSTLDDAPRLAPSTHQGVRRLLPRTPSAAEPRRFERHRSPAYGPSPIVRAYLPRNDAVPMYNEPPAR